MNSKNEAIVQRLIEKRSAEEEKEAEEAKEEESQFKPGEYEIPAESALALENVNLKLELIERDKKEIEAARHMMIAQIAKELGVPDNMRIVGGTSDFRKVSVEERKES